MSKIKNLFLGAFIVLLATSCASDGVKVAVENTTALERQNEMIEVNMDDVAARLQLADTAQVIVLDKSGYTRSGRGFGLRPSVSRTCR